MADDFSSSPVSRYSLSLDSTRSLLTPLYASTSSVEKSGRSVNTSLSDLSLNDSDLDDKYLQRNVKNDNLMSTPIDANNERKTVNTTTESNTTLDTSTSQDFSPWEQWVIKKAIADQHMKLREKHAAKMLLEEQELKNKQKLVTSVLCNENRKEWLTKKKLEEIQKKKEKKYCEINARMIEKERQHYLEVKAEESFKEWLEKKEHEKLKEENKFKLNKEKKYKLIKEKNLENENAYKEWLKKAKTKPKRIPSSLAYSGGKLKGYYDGTSSPSPTFTNPISWNNEKLNKPTTKTLKKEDKCKYESPPLLWKEVKERQYRRSHQTPK